MSHFKGPNEVTLFTTSAFHQIYGPESRCERNAYYDLIKPLLSLLTRDRGVHAQWRKAWDMAFSVKGTYTTPN